MHTVRHAPCHHPPPPRQSGRKISRRKPPDANDRGSPACTRGQNTPSAGEYMRTAGLAPAAVTQCPRRPWLEQAFALLRKFYKVNMSGSPSLVWRGSEKTISVPFESWVQIPSLTGYNHYCLHELKDIVRGFVTFAGGRHDSAGPGFPTLSCFSEPRFSIRMRPARLQPGHKTGRSAGYRARI